MSVEQNAPVALPAAGQEVVPSPVTSTTISNKTTPSTSGWASNYIDVGNGRKRKLRKNGKASRWGPVPKRKRWGKKKDKDSMQEELIEVLDSNLDAVGTELNLL